MSHRKVIPINPEAGCDPKEIAVKSYFLGPASENATWLRERVLEFLDDWFGWRKKLFPRDGHLISSADQNLKEFLDQQNLTTEVIREISARFKDELPKFSPRYNGHMFSEISLPALLGHMITLLHNPNNVSPEASRVGTQIEKEAISLLSRMMGFKDGLGHFTSGGTLANFEFLFRARERLSLWLAASVLSGMRDVVGGGALGWERFHELNASLDSEILANHTLFSHPTRARENLRSLLGFEMNDPVLFVPASKHYSWPKAMHHLGLGESNLKYIELDEKGRLDVENLKRKIFACLKEKVPILGVVAVVGTTELGTIDPVGEVADLLSDLRTREELHLWLHLDAAYGGFFRSIVEEDREPNHPTDHWNRSKSATTEFLSSLEQMSRADSVTLDPHKLGYVPYSSGTFLCRQEDDYFIKSFMGPYIQTDRGNIGNFTIEGSRSAAGAVATYASLKAFESSHGYSRILKRTMEAKKRFCEVLVESGLDLFFPPGMDTNILCFGVMGKERSLSSSNEMGLQLYQQIQESGAYWISKTSIHKKFYGRLIDSCCSEHNIKNDRDEMVLLRLTLMNPFILSKESAIDHAQAFRDLLRAKIPAPGA